MQMVPIIQLLPEVAQICRKAPTGTLIRAYARAANDFCRQSRWLRSNLAGQVDTSAQVYNLGSDPNLQIIGLKACTCAPTTGGNLQPYPLVVSNDTGSWNPNGTATQPQQYAYVPEGQIAFGPNAINAVYNVEVTLVLTPRKGIVSTPEVILAKWENTLQAGALEYLLSLPEMPWTDLAESKRQGMVFRSGINNAKADEQRGYNAGTVFIRRRPFIVGRR